jgi:Fic family protein
MNVSDKLKIILTLTGFTQEKLARELGVSFPTINSWVRKRSEPHPKKGAVIDDFFRQISGSPEIPEGVLETKKAILRNMKEKGPDALGLLRTRRDILDQFCLSLTYNTNRIEGSTLTEPETAAILFDNIALPHKTLVEHMEVKNHQAALLHLVGLLQKDTIIDRDMILKLHSILMNGIQPDAGCYRRHGVRIVGSHVPTANFLKIESLMNEIIDEIDQSHEDVVSHAARIHSQFEQVHPFSDGNGRVGDS